MTTTQQYVFKVTEIVKVTDGDTYWLRLDVGFRQQILIDCRLDGWDCPEANRGSAFEKEKAKAARGYAAEWIARALDASLWIRTEKDPDSFGRWLGNLWTEYPGGEHHLGDALAEKSLATPWPTRWREVYDR